jgi:hypothetical protein
MQNPTTLPPAPSTTSSTNPQTEIQPTPTLTPSVSTSNEKTTSSSLPNSDTSLHPQSQLECLGFTRSTRRHPKNKPRYIVSHQTKLRNSLLAGVGFLELANAGDFAANVWNDLPVPIYAIILMAVGGFLALLISQFAFRDAVLSWRNIKVLREERRRLKLMKTLHKSMGKVRRGIDAMLDVNKRELGTEYVDRLGMDCCMGFGAVAVGVGTLMAIGGANPKVFEASNLLSGYIGNVPCAIYGVVNIGWSCFVWIRAQRQRSGAGSKKARSTEVELLLKRRTSSVQLHALLNGLTGVIGGAFSIVTATRWWGYVPLIPCIASSAALNWLWRQRLGYDRPLFQHCGRLHVDIEEITAELVSVAHARRVLQESPSAQAPFSTVIPDPTSLEAVIDFLVQNDLFERFCGRILKDAELVAALFGGSTGFVLINSRSLVNVDAKCRGRLIDVVGKCLRKDGLIVLTYRERYLLETLGSLLLQANSSHRATVPTNPDNSKEKVPLPESARRYDTGLELSSVVVDCKKTEGILSRTRADLEDSQPRPHG